MDSDLVHSLRLRRKQRETESRHHLITCSLCLRVLRGSEWKDAGQVIREIRSYELDDLPRLESAVCDVCAESIFSRRAQEGEAIAA